MFKNVLIILIMLGSATFAAAQQVLQIIANTDQSVYLSGEEVWVEGSITQPGDGPESIRLHLLDRKGITRAEARLLINDGFFSGSLLIPTDLVSDYYFLDGYAQGYSSSMEIRPVMVINPRMPIAACNSVLNISVPQSRPTMQQITVATNKSTYERREKVQVSTSPMLADATVSIIVQRYDQLAAFADSIIRSFHLVTQHSAIGEKETEGNIINARIVSTMESTPIKGIRVFAAIMGDQAKVSSCVSNQDGRLKFLFPFIYGETQVVFSVAGNADQRYRIEMEEDNTSHAPTTFPCLQLNETMRPAIEERILAYRVQKGYHGDPVKLYSILQADTTDFYGIPDHHYALDDYVRFPDMKEILLEFVPEVRVRNDESALPVVQILDEPYKTYFESAGMVLLDGIPIQDIKELLAFNPLLIKSIDVMSRKYYLGDTTIHGVLHYKTYKGDMAGFTLPVRDVIYPFNGIQIPAVPVFSAYETNKKNPLPHMKNVLFLDLNKKISKNEPLVVSFSATDSEGRYRVILRGTGKNGELIAGEQFITIQ